MSSTPRQAVRAHRTLRARLSRIGVRLLLFNVLAVVMPVAGILYLDVYERQLLDAQERAMVEQGRLVVAAMAGDGPAAATATRLLAHLVPGESRIRVHDRTGAVVADTARAPRASAPPATSYEAAPDTRDAWLYRVGAWLASVRQGLAPSLRSRPTGDDGEASSARPAELEAALAGRYGAASRPTPGQRSLTLTVALPITGREGVAGAVTVSRSTYRILQALYAVRLRIFRIVVATLALSAVISAMVTWTIVRPIRQVRRAALAFARDGLGTPVSFPGAARHDEVGDLARALEELTRRLQAHVTLLESFAGDVAHEFRNPLASLRSALDVLRDVDDAAERERFLAMMQRDVERLDRLVVGMRDLARIDSAIERDALALVDVGALAAEVLSRSGGGVIGAELPRVPVHVRAHPDRLVQVLDNLVDNARSFSPAPGSVGLSLHLEDGHVVVEVSDRGPGIPEEHRTRVFERFFSYRPGPGTARHEHAGLGLAIARAIVDAYGGTIAALPRDGGGARLQVRLPIVSDG